MSTAFPQIGPENNLTNWGVFIQMELPWAVKGALDKETVLALPQASSVISSKSFLSQSTKHLRARNFFPWVQETNKSPCWNC